ncbi:MAG TPA: hybrid sensor histidine kinase/response regulator, partial [Caulobacteraceae bacterium]|nr:hybrid sensor histidine kinase/response regulator [Caulobacteraceae bacterium]
MAEPRAQGAGLLADPLRTIGVVCFLLAVLFAASMAFRAGPVTLAGMILLVGLAGVAFVGLVAFRSGAQAAPEATAADLVDLVQALDDPAAVCVADGLIVAANGGWREAVGS